jgi:hypothetical protein
MNLKATFVHRRILRGPSGGEQSGATAVECGGDGGSALASRLSENEHIGTRNHTIPNGSALPQRHRPSLETLCK